MNEYFEVLLYSAIPFLGNFAGGMISEFITVNKPRLSIALHLAAGIVLAVVGIEIIPKVIKADPFWPVLIAFLIGSGFSILTDKFAEILSKSSASNSPKSIGIYIAVCVDLFSDGLLIAIGSTISKSFGGILAAGKTLADAPEGYASMASLNDSKVSKGKRYLANVSFIIPVWGKHLLASGS